MNTTQDKRFKTHQNGTESYQGKHIKGYIRVERLGLVHRRVCRIHNRGEKHFPANKATAAREWMISQDTPTHQEQTK